MLYIENKVVLTEHQEVLNKQLVPIRKDEFEVITELEHLVNHKNAVMINGCHYLMVN
mgnify:CR=1 FL=1